MTYFVPHELVVDEGDHKVYEFANGGAGIPIPFDRSDRGWRYTLPMGNKPNEFYETLDDALDAVQEDQVHKVL